MILLHCGLEIVRRYISNLRPTSEVKADVNFPLYQLSVKIVDIFITPIILDNNIGFLCLYVEIFVTL